MGFAFCFDLPEPFLLEIPSCFHPSFQATYSKLRNWLARFSLAEDSSLSITAHLFYSLAQKKYLDHRTQSHFFRLILSIHVMQKKLIESAALPSSRTRDTLVRCISTRLLFPHSSEPIVGCLIGFNQLDRCELFDEQNLVTALQKQFSGLEFIKESSYQHISHHKDIGAFYFEIKWKDNRYFNRKEIKTIQENLKKKIEHSIHKLIVPLSAKSNDEETYKNFLTLTNEIRSVDDLPQVEIKLEQRVEAGVLFRLTIAQLAPFQRLSLTNKVSGCLFFSEQVFAAKDLEGHLVEARLIRALLPFTPSLLRLDGSLNEQVVRQQISELLKNLIGEFRDCNGGLLIKQQELLQAFKNGCENLTEEEAEWLDHFFYSLVPLEHQVVLQPHLIHTLYLQFLESRKATLSPGDHYSFQTLSTEKELFFVVRSNDSSCFELLSEILRDPLLNLRSFAYNILEEPDGSYFNCLLLRANLQNDQALLTKMQDALEALFEKKRNQQILRIALEYTFSSLDPCIGGDSPSVDLLRMLFEGLTRINQKGELEKGIAESIDISSDFKRYCFHLRPAFWNDGSPLSAHDFAYAWKRALSPSFETQFATLLYPIKNAREAKEGKVSSDEIAIHVIDDRTLEVELAFPTPYFLDLLAHPPCSPINRQVDQRSPQWIYQAGKDYPCNGPFQLLLNQPGRGYHLVKNPYYWDHAKIVLDQILLKSMDPFRAMQAFQEGQIDWVGAPFGRWHDFPFSAQRTGNIISQPDSLVCWLVFNTAHPLFQHRKWRHAFGHAIDRSGLAQNTSSLSSPAYSLLLRRCRMSRGALFPDYHVDRAQELFQEALEELGLSSKDLPRITLTFVKRGVAEQLAHNLQKQLQRCFGIYCVLQPLPWNILLPRLEKGDFEIALNHRISWIDDPIYTLNTFRFANQGGNLSKWENLEFQQALDRSEQEPNPFQRSFHLMEAEKILSQEMPAIPLTYHSIQTLTKTTLRSDGGALGITRSFFKQQETLYGSSTTRSRNDL